MWERKQQGTAIPVASCTGPGANANTLLTWSEDGTPAHTDTFAHGTQAHTHQVYLFTVNTHTFSHYHYLSSAQ